MTFGGSSLRTCSLVRRKMKGAMRLLRLFKALINCSVSYKFSDIFLMLPVKYLL